MRNKACARAILGVLIAILASWSAQAHEIRPAYLEITESIPGRFEVTWKQPATGEWMLRLEPRLSNGLLDQAADEIYAARSFMIRRWTNLALEPDTFDGATVRIEGLERTLTDVLVEVRFANGQHIQRLLKPENPQFTVELTGAGKLAVPAYLRLGIEHILTGFDHLAFVLGLILLVCGRWQLVKTVTAFTVAHSVTLAVTALGYVRLNVPLIESLVALSIVFVAVELVRSWQGSRGLTVAHPWIVAFSFGLLHGFAFAGSLADIGLPEGNVAAALFMFNLGAEIGQLMFVAAVLALIALWRRAFEDRLIVPAWWAATYAIGIASCYWLTERISAFAAASGGSGV